MPLVSFEALPDEARVWVFGVERTLAEAEQESFLNAVDQFLETWVAHGAPLTCGRDCELVPPEPGGLVVLIEALAEAEYGVGVGVGRGGGGGPARGLEALGEGGDRGVDRPVGADLGAFGVDVGLTTALTREPAVFLGFLIAGSFSA